MSDVKLEDIVSLAKRRGFIFPGSDVYGGLSGTWDYGPLGTGLKRNIINEWLKFFVDGWDDMYQVDAAILMNQKVWQASGHVATFHDPLVVDKKTNIRYRADHLLKDAGVDAKGMTVPELNQAIKEKCVKSPDGNELSDVSQFNMMFKTFVGSLTTTVEAEGFDALGADLRFYSNAEDQPIKTVKQQRNTDLNSVTFYNKDSVSYLRPETAQGMFTNYKNVLDSFYPNLPFGLAQVGKAFRNEISPRDFVFRSREFEQMEIEYFVDPKDWETQFEKWRKDIHDFLESLGLPAEKIHEEEVPAEDRAHYSKRTIDFEFDFPHGRDELLGLAYRTDFDLTNIQKATGKSMEYRPKDGRAPFVPHVIEPSFGVERALMAVLTSAYTEDEVNGEKRTYLKLPYHLAPIKVAVCPLAKNNPELVKKAQEIYKSLKKELGAVLWIDSGNIGKNYRKMDEIGVPYVVTVDFETLEGDTKDTVTVRHRDTTKQDRSKVINLIALLGRA